MQEVELGLGAVGTVHLEEVLCEAPWEAGEHTPAVENALVDGKLEEAHSNDPNHFAVAGGHAPRRQ